MNRSPWYQLSTLGRDDGGLVLPRDGAAGQGPAVQGGGGDEVDCVGESLSAPLSLLLVATEPKLPAGS